MEKTRLIIVLSGTALLIYLLNKEEEKKEPEPVYTKKEPEPEPLYTKKEPEPVYTKKEPEPEPLYTKKEPEPIYTKKEPEPMPLYAKIGIAGISAIPAITAAYIAGKYYFGARHIAHELKNINVSNRPHPEPPYQRKEFREALRQQKLMRENIYERTMYNQYGARRIYRSREEIARGIIGDPAIGRKTPDSD